MRCRPRYPHRGLNDSIAAVRSLKGELLHHERFRYGLSGPRKGIDSAAIGVAQARDSLKSLLDDQTVPMAVRRALADDYRQLKALFDKLDQNQIHISVFGRVSVGKSALLNALLEERLLTVSPLHGETKTPAFVPWAQFSPLRRASDADTAVLVDTPGIDEIDGERRERVAKAVAARSDIVIFVVDGDLTDTEYQALHWVADGGNRLLLVLNKADHYSPQERDQLLAVLRRRSAQLVEPDDVVAVVAEPTEQLLIVVDEHGGEQEQRHTPPPDVAPLLDRLEHYIDSEGRTLAALNATLLAGEFCDRLSAELLAFRRQQLQQLCWRSVWLQGVAVLLLPALWLDLAALIIGDSWLLWAQGRLQGVIVGWRVLARGSWLLWRALGLQLGALVAVTLLGEFLLARWGDGGGSAGPWLVALMTGAAASWGSWCVAKAGENHWQQSRAWGELGPKRIAQAILTDVERDEHWQRARDDLLARFRPLRS